MNVYCVETLFSIINALKLDLSIILSVVALAVAIVGNIFLPLRIAKIARADRTKRETNLDDREEKIREENWKRIYRYAARLGGRTQKLWKKIKSQQLPLKESENPQHCQALANNLNIGLDIWDVLVNSPDKNRREPPSVIVHRIEEEHSLSTGKIYYASCIIQILFDRIRGNVDYDPNRVEAFENAYMIELRGMCIDLRIEGIQTFKTITNRLELNDQFVPLQESFDIKFAMPFRGDEKDRDKQM